MRFKKFEELNEGREVWSQVPGNANRTERLVDMLQFYLKGPIKVKIDPKNPNDGIIVSGIGERAEMNRNYVLKLIEAPQKEEVFENPQWKNWERHEEGQYFVKQKGKRQFEIGFRGRKFTIYLTTFSDGKKIIGLVGVREEAESWSFSGPSESRFYPLYRVMNTKGGLDEIQNKDIGNAYALFMDTGDKLAPKIRKNLQKMITPDHPYAVFLKQEMIDA